MKTRDYMADMWGKADAPKRGDSGPVIARLLNSDFPSFFGNYISSTYKDHLGLSWLISVRHGYTMVTFTSYRG
jgi:hypothetical protein